MSTEYIERGSKIEALMQRMRKLGADKPEASQEAKVMAFLDFYVIRELENTPAADVEPVVRCEACRYNPFPNDGDAWCTKNGGCHKQDYYCADGAHVDEGSGT